MFKLIFLPSIVIDVVTCEMVKLITIKRKHLELKSFWCSRQVTCMVAKVAAELTWRVTEVLLVSERKKKE